MSTLTLETLAEAKKLPAEFLRSLGVEDMPSGKIPGVLIGYLDENGKQHSRVRLRAALRAKDGSRWLGDKSVKPIAYGAWRLNEAREKGWLPLVEGETDAWTLWFHGYPALGIPGATMAKTLEAGYLDRIERVFVYREPGQSGDTFTATVGKRLKELRFAGDAYEISIDGFKDPSDLHCDDPAHFKEQFKNALNHAVLLNLADPVNSDSADVAEQAFTIPVSDIEPEQVEWLWNQRIAIGKLNILTGDPGLGKSFVTLDVAAHVTAEIDFPDGTPCTRGSVLLITAEDGIADTVRPRLEAQSADVTRVHRLTIRAGDSERQFSLGSHLPALREKLGELADVRLLIIDPLTAYLGETDPNKDAKVRALLTPLAELAEEMRVAILAVMHLNKAAVLDIIYRVTGSVAFIAQARAVWAVVEDPSKPGRRLFLKLKNNLARADLPGLAFAIREDEEGRARLEWEPEPVRLNIREVMGGFSNARRPRGPKADKLEDAKAFLRETLSDGEKHSSNRLIAEAKALGISYSTLDRASRELSVNRKKARSAGDWTWQLSPSVIDPDSAGSEENVGTSLTPNPNLISSAESISPNGLAQVTNLKSSAQNREALKFHEKSDKERF